MKSMATTLEDGERISLSRLDVRILVALLVGQQSGYEIGRQCEQDAKGAMSVGNGALFPALKHLKAMGFIHPVGARQAGPGKPRQLYRITPLGHEVLSWELESLEYLVQLADTRNQIRLPKNPQ